MDTDAVFKSLQFGTRFDKSKFKKDFEVFERKSENVKADSSSQSNALDFFKKNHTEAEENPQPKKRKKIDSNENKKKTKESIEEIQKNEKKESKSSKKRKNKIEQVENDVSDISLIKNKKEKHHSKEEKEQAELIAAENERKRLEAVNHLRNQHKIKVFGTDIPDPIENFSQLQERYNVHPYLIKNIESLKYTTPTPIQMQALACMLHNREVLAVAPTGSGKTTAFAVPILSYLNEPNKDLGFRAIIVSPTRELAKQTHREILKLAHGKAWKIRLLTKATAPSVAQTANHDILITTPQRLVQLTEEKEVSLENVEILIFDEADRLFEEQFIEQVDKIIAACPNKDRKISLFSATMLPAIEQLARSVQKDPIRIVVGSKNAATDTISQKLVYCGSEQGKLLALKQLILGGKLKPPVLIFVQSKERADELFKELVYERINVDTIHADRSQAHRTVTVDKFRSGEIWVLVTTDLMARGIDFKGVNLVINYDFPQSTILIDLGRTGRAGRSGEAITFYTEEDLPYLKSIANVMKESGVKDLPAWLFTVQNIRRKDKKKLEKKPIERESIKPKVPNKFKNPGKFSSMNSATKYNCFVYGSLMSNQILDILLKRVPKQHIAILQDYHRYKIQNRVYPAIYPTKGSHVQGKILLDLNEKEKVILDHFEDVEYDCLPVSVEAQISDQTKEIMQAHAYVYKTKETLYDTWNYEDFEKNSLKEFAEMCRKYAEGIHSNRVPF